MQYDSIVDNIPVRFVIAFLIGALIGIEREKVNRDDGENKSAGLRTFILIAVSGAMAAWFSVETGEPWYFVAATIVCAAFIIAGYRAQLRTMPDSIGLTTEFAGFVTFLLGGITVFGAPQLAVGIAIVTSALLAYREALHGAVERIGWDDIFAALKLFIIAFIVLPVAPREAVDPWGVIEPYAMTWLVLLIAGLSFLGYIVARWLGPKRGVAVTGLAGGLVSSTAVTLALAKQSRTHATAGAAPTLAAGILFAWAVMFVRVVVECAVINPSLARQLAIPMGIMALVAVAGAIVNQRRGARFRGNLDALQLRNPFSLSFAIKFALMFAAVAVLVDRAQELVSEQAAYAVAGLAGLTDVDAITLSMARRGPGGATAVTTITIAVLSNTLTKIGIVWWLGRGPLLARILPAGIVIVAGAVLSLVFVAL
jgi:uncharacterized membrane protein (DUF4010 family)